MPRVLKPASSVGGRRATAPCAEISRGTTGIYEMAGHPSRAASFALDNACYVNSGEDTHPAEARQGGRSRPRNGRLAWRVSRKGLRPRWWRVCRGGTASSEVQVPERTLHNAAVCRDQAVGLCRRGQCVMPRPTPEGSRHWCRPSASPPQRLAGHLAHEATGEPRRV
jgi:hypothetical protein